MTSPGGIADSVQPDATRSSQRNVVLIGFGLLVLTAGLASITPNFFEIRQTDPLILFAVGLAFAVGEHALFQVEARAETASYSASDVVLAVGIVFLDPLSVIALLALGSSLAQVASRRIDLLKWGFNRANHVLQISFAFATFRLLVPEPNPGASIVLWAALFGALFASQLSNHLAVVAAIACFDGGFARRARQAVTQARNVHLPGATVASAVATAMLVEVWLGFVIATVAPVVWQLGSLRRRFEDLTSAQLFAGSLSCEADLGSIVTNGATHIAENLRAGSVAIRVWRADGSKSEFASGPTDLLGRLPESVQSWRPSADVAPSAFIIAPLGDERGVLGAVAITDRAGARDTFDKADQVRLSTLLSQLAVAVRKSQLYSQIQYDATHDRVTGLVNRGFFEAWVNDATEVPTHRGSLLVVGLDNLKDIIDAFGNEAGNQLLHACGTRIVAAAPRGSVVGRLASDRFAVYLANTSRASTIAIARRINDAVDQPHDLNDVSVAVMSRIGISYADRDGDAPTQLTIPMLDDALDDENRATVLIRHANLAMDESKRCFVGFVEYSPDLEEDDALRIAMVADLREALHLNQLEVAYQPKIDLATGTVTSTEALARWTHPEQGPIRPDVFVELAEQAGLIWALTDVVLGQATAAAASWQQRGWGIGVAVNISAQSLIDERLVDMVSHHLHRTNLDPHLLTLEVTESTMMGDAESIERMLHRLTAIGVDISVDDFGTGFSSLSSLRQLPVSEVKIDRSFVSAMHDNNHDAIIVRATIEMAHELGLRIVAEGVETLGVLSKLRALDCDIAQGFGISQPMPFLQTTAWIEAGGPKDRLADWRWASHVPPHPATAEEFGPPTGSTPAASL